MKIESPSEIIIQNLREVIRIFPTWKEAFFSSERKKAIVALRQILEFVASDIAVAAEALGITSGEMSHRIYQPNHFAPEEWSYLLELFKIVTENRAEIFHKAHSSSRKKEKLKV